MTAPKPMDPSASAALIRSALPHIEADDLRVQVAHALANLLALTKRLGEELEGLRADRDEAVAKLRVVVAGQTEALDKLGRSWQSLFERELMAERTWEVGNDLFVIRQTARDPFTGELTHTCIGMPISEARAMAKELVEERAVEL